MGAYEPVAPHIPKARAQVETARVWPVVQAHVGHEFLAGTQARRRV
jgi:hypothetical protein